MSSLRNPNTQSTDASKKAWAFGFREFLVEVPNYKFPDYQYENYAAKIKDIFATFMVLSALASTSDSKPALRARALTKIVAICLESKSLGYFKDDIYFLAKLNAVVRRLVNQAETEDETLLKNRLIVMLSENNVAGTLALISEATRRVAISWEIHNYSVDQDFLNSLTPWLEQNEAIAKQSFFRSAVISKKLQESHYNKNKKNKQKNKKEIGKKFYWIAAILFALSMTSGILRFASMLDYGYLLMAIGMFFSAIYAIKGAEYFPASESAYGKLKKDWHDSVNQFLTLKFVEPKAKKNYEVKINLEAYSIQHIDYSTPNKVRELQPRDYRCIVDKLDENKKPSCVATSDNSKIEIVDSEKESTALYTEINFISSKHLSFKYKNICYHARLDEEALPEGLEGKAIKLAFQKGPMKASADRSVHAIVKASTSDFCLFKIRTAYKGRLKASASPLDAGNIELNFDLYDRNSHDHNRRLGH